MSKRKKSPTPSFVFVSLLPVWESYFKRKSLSLRFDNFSGSAKRAFLSLQKKWASNQLPCCWGNEKHSVPIRWKLGGHMAYMRLKRGFSCWLWDWEAAMAPPDVWGGEIFSKLTPTEALDWWYWPHAMWITKGWKLVDFCEGYKN